MVLSHALIVPGRSVDDKGRDSPERDKVLVIDETHDSLRIVFWNREQCFDDTHRPLAEFGREVFEDQIGILLRYRAIRICADVVSECHVVKGEGEGGTMREMGDDHGVRPSSSFVKKDEIGHVLCATCLDERAHDGVTPVESIRVRKDQSQLLRWGLQLLIHDLRIDGKLTFENCSNLDEGDLEVVITIFGSYVPTLAYSSSM